MRPTRVAIRIGFICLSIVVAACATTTSLFAVRVTSDSATDFYYFRKDIWDSKNLGAVVGGRSPDRISSFGPYKIGSQVPVEKGAAFVFVPVCKGEAAWDKPSHPVISNQEDISVGC
jgi:hypothetical protein